LEKAKKIADNQGQKVHIGNILSSEIFYNADQAANKKWQDVGILAVEMESVALYWNAIQARVKALCILTVSDHLITGAKTTPEERQTAFTKMMEIALELA
jgi:purine-nucleoside phosphorylase